MKSIFAIIGATATGKTALALALAKRLPIEIISMDSALIYQGMDIGTAKPDKIEQSICPHHLIDIKTPLQTYSAADFVEDCTKLCDEIQSRGHIPLIVGGTMMYFRSLTQGLNNLPSADEQVRSLLQEEKRCYGLNHLYRELQKIDPATANKLDCHDSQRIERALEVFRITGIPMSELLSQQQMPRLNVQAFGLMPNNRKQLHLTIEQRFYEMIKKGFLDEVRHLKQTYPDLTLDYPSMRCVGYRQAWQHLSGEIDLKTFIQQGIVATRQLAKRQITWLRSFQIPMYDYSQNSQAVIDDLYIKIKQFYKKKFS
ncbi:MAG: tRNA (adenosine(37)-N6)-dimethylallyltransferase MiaA [Neisseriaceae bacterium]|nr:tRNA (adenosine(37)-N6)-dimethylallyltransferase MiaA [Neisseriaceae bacterium]